LKEPSAAVLVAEVERELAALDAPTRVIAWNPGDAKRVSRRAGCPRIRPIRRMTRPRTAEQAR
jgi:hypothetical protein